MSEPVLEPYDPTLARYKRVLSPGEPGYGLCEVCRTIDFASFWLIEPSAFPKSSIWGITVFRFPEEWPFSSKPCSLCKIIAYIWDREEMRESDPQSDMRYRPIRSRELLLWRSSLTSEEPLGLWFRGGYHRSAKMRLSYSSSGPGLPPIRSYLNYVWLKSQIACLDQKSVVGAQQQNKNILISLVDCETLTIVQADTSVCYIALSYIIGPGHNVIHGNDPSSKLNTDLPRTSSDAISLTKNLGKRYLWVDRYCISGHGDLRKAQLLQMADVYSSA